ncbi:MAG: hypothetical protein P4L40_00030 [Terracidiphilus sp.]|nr:hypothetical protein [Terracidiphilus sp.]
MSVAPQDAPAHPYRKGGPQKLPPLKRLPQPRAPQLDEEDEEGEDLPRVISASAQHGAAAVAEKIRSEVKSKSTKLTRREKKQAVGEWMFGEGGIRGLT